MIPDKVVGCTIDFEMEMLIAHVGKLLFPGQRQKKEYRYGCEKNRYRCCNETVATDSGKQFRQGSWLDAPPGKKSNDKHDAQENCPHRDIRIIELEPVACANQCKQNEDTQSLPPGQVNRCLAYSAAGVDQHGTHNEPHPYQECGEQHGKRKSNALPDQCMLPVFVDESAIEHQIRVGSLPGNPVASPIELYVADIIGGNELACQIGSRPAGRPNQAVQAQ